MRCLKESFDECQIIVFDNAPEMIACLKEVLNGLHLICLDHDLGENRLLAGEIQDPGTGQNVTDYLSSRQAVCPVIIHSSNFLATPGMMMVLEESGWKCSKISPFNDLEWIPRSLDR